VWAGRRAIVALFINKCHIFMGISPAAADGAKRSPTNPSKTKTLKIKGGIRALA